MTIRAVLATVLLVVGVLLLAHDALYHVGVVAGVGRPVRIGKLRIHHGDVGLVLILLGLLLLAGC